MFHKHNSLTNTLTPADQVSSYSPQIFGTTETTNNYFVAPQPKGRQPGGPDPKEGSVAGRQMSLLRFVTGKLGVSSSGSVAGAHTAVASSSHGAVAHGGGHGASGGAVHGHAGGHGDSHAAPWEGVNLWRTPFKGDTDTVTHVKRTKGVLDRYIEKRTRYIQQMQIYALRNKHKPIWLMMPRDKVILSAQAVIALYVIWQVGNTLYQHLKAKDRLKLYKLFYKDNVD